MHRHTFSYTADGNLYFSGVAETKKAPVLTLTYLWNSTSDAERAKYEARTTTYLRLLMNGPTELDSGQSNVPYVQIDGAYRYRSFPVWNEDSGLTTFDVVADTQYDTTGASAFEVTILSLLSAYP